VFAGRLPSWERHQPVMEKVGMIGLGWQRAWWVQHPGGCPVTLCQTANALCKLLAICQLLPAYISSCVMPSAAQW
jgi:hypothetical protein